MFVVDTNVVSELRKVRSSKAGKSLAAWSASVTRTTSITVVTRNVADFENTGVRVVNPWSFAAS